MHFLKASSFINHFLSLNLHRKIYIFGLMVLAVGLAVSPIFVSVGQFIIGFNWFAEGKFKQKKQIVKNHPFLWTFFLLPAVLLIWMFNTSDIAHGLHDLKIKIPLLFLPMIIGTSQPLSQKELKWVLTSFVFGVICGTIVSFSIITGLYPYEYNDIRDVSFFISHIRFSLMMLFSIVICGYYFTINYHSLLIWQKIGLIALVLWLLIFIIIIQSVTSWVILVVLLVVLISKFYKKIKNRSLRYTLLIAILGSILWGIGLTYKVYHDFYQKPTIDLTNLPQYTQSGNKYFHNIKSKLKENGHYINVLICKEEIRETWPTVSKIPLKGKDKKGNTLYYTLIRYLSSKGLAKDKEGILALTDQDIYLIENGYASCVYGKNFIPYVKIYNIIWEVDRYFKNGNANGKSIVQRIEFERTALHIIKNNFWLGVGTGDIPQAFKQAYIETKSSLSKENQLRTHNQYLTFFATFGIFGFLIAIFGMYYPIYSIKNTNILLSIFIILISISMLNEDTLETQAGVTFYMFFYIILSFTERTKNKN